MREQQIAGSNCLYGRWSWAAVLRAQERLGRKHMALYPLPAHLWLDHIRCVGLEPLKQSLADRQITVSSFHPGKYQYSLFESGDSLRGSSTIRYYKNCVDGAAALGCARVCVRPAGSFLDGDPNRAWDVLAENLSQLCAYAGQKQVRICVQTIRPDEGGLLRTVQELERLLELVPEAWAALDTVSLSQAGETIPQWFDRLGYRIGHVCFWDGRNDGGRIWGEGVYPSRRYLRQLVQSGYEGPVSLCGYTQRYEQEPEAADTKNLARIQRLLHSLEGD